MFEFDETYYLENNPDVAAAVKNGEWPSGLMHYNVSGRAKGRRAVPPVDVEWYVSAYPQAAVEIAAGKASSAADHYHRMGKSRGYLPSQHAARPANPAAPRSRHGGLWTDAGNALDIIAGRLDIGQITAPQAAALTTWVIDGFLILPGAVPTAVLDAAEADLDRAFRGEWPGLRFALLGGADSVEWRAEVATQPAVALDLHWASTPIRQLIFSPKILAFLHLLFERRVLASQTLGASRGWAHEPQQDSANVVFSLPLQFVGCSIAFEDLPEGTGELYAYRGSHRLAEFPYGDHKSAEEAKRLVPDLDVNSAAQRHLELVRRQAAGLGLEAQHLRAKRGDAIVWCADLVHGQSALSSSLTRKNVVAHYCPAEVAPDYFESGRSVQIRAFTSTSCYTTAHYRE
jgi:phytanoyl-CoA hydroxylase